MGNIWTAVSREVLNNRLVSVGFIGENNIRTTVPAENLAVFFDNNNVTNIIYDDAINDIVGKTINIDYLDTYRHTNSGRVLIKPGVGEYQLLQLAQKDINRLKKEQSKHETEQKISEKRDSTNRKLAVVAVILGVAADKIKHTSKSFEQHTYSDLKGAVYKSLKRYNLILDQLIEAKYKTNNKIELDESIYKYNVQLDSNSIDNQELKYDIEQFGLVKYIKNIQTLIEVCLEQVIKFGLLDDSLREFGAETTLRNYRASLDSKINKLKDLHMHTKELLQENFSKRPPSQDDIYIEKIEKSIKELEHIVALNYKDRLHDISEHDIKERIAQIIDIDTTDLKLNIAHLDDETAKNDYYDYVYSLETMLTECQHNLNSYLQRYTTRNKHKLDEILEEIKLLIESLQNDQYTNDETKEIIGCLTSELNGVQSKLKELPENMQTELQEKYERIKSLADKCSEKGETA